jgi:hypothetical protein
VRLLIASLTSTAPIDQASPLAYSMQPENKLRFPPVFRIVRADGKVPPGG